MVVFNSSIGAWLVFVAFVSIVFEVIVVILDFIISIAFCMSPSNLKSFDSIIVFSDVYTLIPIELVPFNLKLLPCIVKSSHNDNTTPYAYGLEDIKSILIIPYVPPPRIYELDCVACTPVSCTFVFVIILLSFNYTD